MLTWISQSRCKVFLFLKLAMARPPWCHSNRSVLFLPVGTSSSGRSACQKCFGTNFPLHFLLHLAGILIGSVALCWQCSVLPSGEAKTDASLLEYRCFLHEAARPRTKLVVFVSQPSRWIFFSVSKNLVCVDEGKDRWRQQPVAMQLYGAKCSVMFCIWSFN